MTLRFDKAIEEILRFWLSQHETPPPDVCERIRAFHNLVKSNADAVDVVTQSMVRTTMTLDHSFFYFRTDLDLDVCVTCMTGQDGVASPQFGAAADAANGASAAPQAADCLCIHPILFVTRRARTSFI